MVFRFAGGVVFMELVVQLIQVENPMTSTSLVSISLPHTLSCFINNVFLVYFLLSSKEKEDIYHLDQN